MSVFTGITRERVYSPGRVGDDRAILEAVAAALRAAGHAVQVLDGDADDWPAPPRGATVFTMAQGPRALARLGAWQQAGLRIVNSPRGILNCQRHRALPLLTAAGVPVPPSQLLATDGAIPDTAGRSPAWLKRGDVHATDPGDVVAVDSPAALRRGLADFRARGIGAAILQEHVAGTVLKFYAVRGRFLHVVEPPGAPGADAALRQRIDRLGQQAAAALEVEIYGGDCVCDVAGRLTLIDLNDWPSYAPCRSAAARAIAAYLQEVTASS